MEFDAIKWHNSLLKGNLIYSYKGTIDSKVVEEILSNAEDKLNAVHDTRTLRKRCYNVLVEATQNLYHHAIDVPTEVEKQHGKRFAFFAFTATAPSTYRISLGNYIRKDNIRQLQERLDQINYLSAAELKVLYKLILNNNEFSEKGGGGLGLIDIARRTGNKLEYNFYKYNDEYFFFALEIVIS